MAESEKTKQSTKSPRLTIRVGRGTLAFAQPNMEGNHLTYETYEMKNGISMAANLREAVRRNRLLAQTVGGRVQVMVDAPVMMVPVEEFRAETVDSLFQHTFTGRENEQVMWSVLPSLNAVAVFSVNKDLRLVVDDNFPDAKWNHVCAPVWTHLHRRSFTGTRRKLYGYFHDRRLELFAYQQNRFRFVNSYEAVHTADAVYFILNVWKLLGYDQQRDEMHLAGILPDGEQMQEELHQYLRNVYKVNPNAEFNRAEVTKIEGMPYDLMALFAK